MKEVSIVLAYCDTEEKTNVLSRCIDSLISNNQDIILVSHSEIPYHIYSKCEIYHYNSDNGVLYYDDFKKYNISFFRWFEIDGVKFTITFKFFHSYAVWQLMRDGTFLAKYLGYDIIHFINYDCIVDDETFLNNHTSLLQERDFVFYDFGDLESDEFITFLFSGRVSACEKIFSYFKTIDEYFIYNNNTHILEHRIKDVIKAEGLSYYLFKKSLLNNLIKNTNIITIDDTKIFADENFSFNIFAEKTTTKKYIAIFNGKHNSEYEVYVDGVNLWEFKLWSQQRKLIEINDFNSIQINKDGEIVFSGMPIIYPENTIEFAQAPEYKISSSFVEGALFDYQHSDNKRCFVEFINDGNTDYAIDLQSGHYAKTNKTYFVDWIIKYTIGDEINFIRLDLTGKKVYIPFESGSLGDTIAWMPHVDLFRKKHNCELICSTFHNELFENQYNNIKFIKPGEVAHNLYAIYRLGYFYDNNGYNINRHPNNPQHQPLSKIASDILGLDYIESKPLLPKLDTKKERRVCIAIHSTAQSKYWNNENGWQEVVDYLLSHGYEVRLLSHEEDGYMGNKNPIGVTQQPKGSLLDVLKVLQESEFFIGISSGLSWLSWAAGIPTVIISGFTDDYLEPQNGVYRVINKNVCHGCWHTHMFDPGDWNWCPKHKGTDRQFECSKTITSGDVIQKLRPLVSKNEN